MYPMYPVPSEEESDNQVSRGGDFDYMDSSVSGKSSCAVQCGAT